MNGSETAFPFVCSDHSKTQTALPGLSKREYFAAMAMQGLMGSYMAPKSQIALQDTAKACGVTTVGVIAKVSCDAADALIAALSKGETK